jgi:prephenate dehydratase
MKVHVLGPEGTYSHEVASRLGENEIVLLETIGRIFAQVQAGHGDGIVPLENSEAGGVGATLDGLLTHDVAIIAEYYLQISHCLVSLSPPDRIAMLYSHPQTHEQCSHLVDRLGLPVIHTSSNAASARACAADYAAGALTSPMAAALAGLPILDRGVQDNPANTTRFVRITRWPGVDSDARKCSVIIDPSADVPGLLAALLDPFAKRQINLTRIESRPSKRGIGSYVFFLDFEISEEREEALAEIEPLARVKRLGCYNRFEVPPWM